MNFLKVFYNSFFRTLGRIIVYILFGLVFSIILSKIDVHADSDKYVKLDGDILNYKNFITIGQGNRVIEFDEGTLYTTLDQIPQNFLITFCSDTPKITSWYSNVNDNEFPHELNIYKTDIPCQFSTSDYSGGRIVYFYGTSFSSSVTGTNGSSWGKWTFYQPDSSSYQLLNFITTNDDISIDFSSGAVITQNQQIINQNQQIINQGQQTNEKLNDINSSINNGDVDDPSSSINSFKDKIATNGVITQLIGLPVTLFTKVLNSVNGTCSTYNLGSLFGTDLILPCVNIQNYLGSSLWTIIDVLISGLFVYSISRKFIKVFESMSSMNEGDVIGD